MRKQECEQRGIANKEEQGEKRTGKHESERGTAHKEQEER